MLAYVRSSTGPEQTFLPPIGYFIVSFRSSVKVPISSSSYGEEVSEAGGNLTSRSSDIACVAIVKEVQDALVKVNAMPHKQADRGIRYRRIRNLYVCTAVVGTGTGLMILVAPRTARWLLGAPSGLPEQDPIVFGLLGAFWLAVALISLLGLRSPLQFLPLFLIQLVYKSLWFLFVFAPLAMRGEFPLHGTMIAVGNALWIAMDLRAIPFRYLLRGDFGLQKVRSEKTPAPFSGSG